MTKTMSAAEAIKQLHALIGAETELDVVARRLRLAVGRARPSAAGALQVTCCDEAEQECVEAFRRSFVRQLLPDLKSGLRSSFRVASLGGRYEWGVLRVAEAHFATARSRDRFKVLVAKVNAHVAVQAEADGFRFGHLTRYGRDDVACGALHALLDGTARDPFAGDLADALASEGLDRLAILRDPERVAPRLRGLFAAVASARIQARNVVLEAQAHTPATPTLYIVLPCVTLNQPGPDREIVVGVYRLDHRTANRTEEYTGLGDDPAAYRLEIDPRNQQIRVADAAGIGTRSARDHRRLIENLLEERGGPAAPRRTPEIDDAIATLEGSHRSWSPYARAALRTLLRALANTNPVSGVISLFIEGLIDIRHAHRLHRIARGIASEDEARAILGELCRSLDGLSREAAAGLAGALVRHYSTPRS